MRALEFIIEYKKYPTEDYEGLKMSMVEKDGQLIVKAIDDWGVNELGYVIFNIGDNDELDPQDLRVEDRYQGQGIARIMYDYVTSHGYEIHRSYDQTDDGAKFWDKNQGKDKRVWEDEISEVNYPDELNISDAIQQYFFDRGYKLLGEGRDQMAFESPRGTVVKVLGIGETEREDIVKMYVSFFLKHQNNPYYPKIYNTGEFKVDGETYFVYEMEYLTYVADEEEVLEYIEDLMTALPRGETALNAFYKNKQRPNSLPEDEVAGLVRSTQELEAAIGGKAPLDLSMIENIRRRNNGHLVIMDPYSL